MMQWNKNPGGDDRKFGRALSRRPVERGGRSQVLTEFAITVRASPVVLGANRRGNRRSDLTSRHRCVLRRLAQHDRRLDISEGGDIGPDFSHAWIIESSLQGLW